MNWRMDFIYPPSSSSKYQPLLSQIRREKGEIVRGGEGNKNKIK